MSVELKAKCTSCGGTYVMSQAQSDEARDFGCAMSPCCGAVATVQRVTLTVPVKKAQRR